MAKTILTILTTIPAALGAVLAGALLTGAHAAMPCAPAEGREAVRIAGEVSGSHLFTEAFGPGWVFELTPAARGWVVRIPDSGGIDLAQMTPPLHGPNPRQLFGWHFRNAANTGPNEGDVNAPQRLRLFGFDPSLSGTGGWKAPPSGEGADDQPGRGALEILDMGLADLEPGAEARLVYLRFDACLTWPSVYGAARPAAAESPVEISPEDEEQVRACGLDDGFALGTYLGPATLGGDFDGDGALDLAAAVTRKSDGKRAIAFCRAGTWLDVIGLEGRWGVHLVADYFDNVDWWGLVERGPVFMGGEGTAPPTLLGDAVVMGKEDSSSVMIYWDGEGWTSYWQGD